MQLRDLPIDDPSWEQAFPVLCQLRDHLDRPTFETVHRAGAPQGLTFTGVFTGPTDDAPAPSAPETVVCVGVAGWRLMDSASVIRKLFVDDLVVDRDHRSRGIGALLLDHLEQIARDAHARCVELDSGHQRTDAHRFYRARGYQDTGLTFRKPIGGPA